MKKTKKSSKKVVTSKIEEKLSMGDIQIINEIQNEDGTINYTFEVDDIFLAKYKKATGARVIDEKLLGKFILDLIKDAAKEVEESASKDVKS